MIVSKIDVRPLRKALGHELLNIRQQNNLTIAELSRLSGISAKMIEHSELGRFVPVYLLAKLIIFHQKKIKNELVD